MNLRRQLMLVSLLTLILPWAGCQFIRETESALREGQQQMLGGTAKAIADSLSQYPDDLLSSGSYDAANRIYAHPLVSAPLIDGYVNEWIIPDGAMATLRGTDGAIRYVVGAHSQYWYLYIDVRDSSIVFVDSQSKNGEKKFSDYVSLVSFNAAGVRDVFRFSAEAPGDIVTTRETGRQIFDEMRVTAYWQDTANGYSLEARVPRTLAGPRIGLAVTNTDDASRPGVTSATYVGDNPGPIVTVSPVLRSVAAGYVQPGLRLIITDKDGWRVAEAGSISNQGPGDRGSSPPSGWLKILYNLLLEPGAEAVLAEPAASGREQQSYIGEALRGVPSTKWFRSPGTGRAVVAVAQPVWSGTVQTGAVVLQQGTDAILSLTNQALTRLIILTLIATVVVAVVLLGYASWLSLRIRQLSNAAERALDEKRLHSALPSALAGDEVGDLSRSFSSVLRQLGNYNDYLQSLAGKLSHELRTPLTIVRSSLENLVHESLSAEATEYTARAMEGTDRLQKILNAMSEANRTEELMKNFESESFDLGEVLASAVAAYADAWPERKFKLRRHTGPAILDGSPELIIQLLDKLVGNAVDFTGVGDVIDVSLDAETDSLVMAVTNPGPPLPEKMGNQLFRSLVSVRSGDAGKHLGLGLYIARIIAEGHGGSISAANTDVGVSFQVRLPAGIST
ncbi:MAG: ATP-binding protein [Proteobacteria bacterium]|nr:ATP-binding protein [Pseudomonadota bacterium]MDA0992215.1 ATP-binding protein [Pseudomonadota bacterium]